MPSRQVNECGRCKRSRGSRSAEGSRLGSSEPPELGDFEGILRVLVEHEVEFVVIRGWGAILQGVPLLSLDLDVVPNPSEINLVRLTTVLVALQAEVIGAGKVRRFPDGEWLRSARFWNFRTSKGRFDVLFAPAGMESYDDLFRAAEPVVTELGDRVLAASVDSLIAMKEATGRDKDQRWLPQLYYLRDRNRGSPPIEP